MENANISSGREVFCRFIRKNGRVIYPKNAKFFHFWVDDSANYGEKAEQLSFYDKENLK